MLMMKLHFCSSHAHQSVGSLTRPTLWRAWLPRRLQRQPGDVRGTHNAQGFNLQLPRIQIVPEPCDEGLASEQLRRQQRQQMATRRLFGHAGVSQYQAFALRVLSNVLAVDDA